MHPHISGPDANYLATPHMVQLPITHIHIFMYSRYVIHQVNGDE